MKFFNKMTLVVFALTLVFTAIQFPNLPNEVPSHYNIMGEPDAWANKWFIFFIPLVGLALWLLLGQIEKYPQFINMPNDGKPLSEAQLQNAIGLMNTIRNEMLLFMSLVTLKEVFIVIGYPIHLGVWEIVIFVSVIMITLIWYIMNNQKLKNV